MFENDGMRGTEAAKARSKKDIHMAVCCLEQSRPSVSAQNGQSDLPDLRPVGMDVLGDSLPYSIEDGHPVVRRARFDALMAHVRAGAPGTCSRDVRCARVV